MASPTPAPPVTVSQPLQRAVDIRVGLSRPVFRHRPGRIAGPGRRNADRNPFQGRPDRPQGDLLFVIDPRPYEIRLAQAQGGAADRDGPRGARQHPAVARAIASPQRVRNPGNGRPAHQRPGCVASRGRRRQGADAGCRARSRILPRRARRSPGASARVRSRSEAWSREAARRPVRPRCWRRWSRSIPLYLDFDMSESDFLTFSRERARVGGPLADKVVHRSQRREQFLPRRHARLHRQCARSLQRHHSCARHGAEPGPVPGAGPVRAAAGRDRAARAGLSAAGRRGRARPVAASGDDGRPLMRP